METKKGISGAILKWLAIVTMLTDHIGASVLKYQYLANHIDYSKELAYNILRNVGRIAFPIFIFLLVEGYQHTKSRKKYLLRLLIFGIISEIPFDMAFNTRFFHWKYQNVFFTLALGFIAIWIMDELNKKSSRIIKNAANLKLYNIFLDLGVTLVFSLLAQVLETDYHAVGVLAICTAWMLKDLRYLQMPVCCLVLLLSSMREWYALAACIPILFYNGKRGKQHKYFSYFFYPVHLLILGYISMFIM